MDRASELEAAIADAPDRREPYLVYADYLLEQGDRRGQLIMMHAAGNTGQTIMKELAIKRDDVEQTWFMGFIDTVKISGDRALFALAEIFEHPSGKFVQQIALAHETPGVIAFIIDRAPRTLARVQVGTVGTWTPPRALLEAFPRMRAGLGLAQAAERARAQKLSTSISASVLPAFADVETSVVLKGLRAELEKARPIGMLDALKASFTPDTLDAFAVALGEQWEQHADETWAFRALGRLGGERTASFLGERFTQMSHARAVQALELLEMIGSPLAVTEMAWAWGKITRYRPRREEARRALEQLADRRGLGSAMELILRNPGTAIAPQRWFLHEMMVQGTQITVADFQQLVLGATTRAGLARHLLWGAYDHGGELVEAFTSDAAPREPYVGVIHPVELDRAQRARWAAVLPDQPFLQLARPVFDKVPDYTKDPIGRDAVVARLADRDWYVAEQGDRGVATALARDFHRDGVTVYVMVGDGRLGNVGAQTFHGAVRRLKDLHPVTRSELVMDLEHGVGRLSLAPMVEVVVEIAKTGRAKCVVCDRTIAKGTERVGVERLIQTEKFSGRGMVWAHYDCRDRVPEAAGI